MLAVEADQLQVGQACQQGLEFVAQGFADGAVQAALTVAAAHRVPEGDAVAAQQGQSRVVGQLGRGLARQPAHDGPELVAWVRVVGPGRQGGIAGKAAQQQDACVFTPDRGQSLVGWGGGVVAAPCPCRGGGE